MANGAPGAAGGPLPILDVCTGTGDLALAYDRAAGGKNADRRRRFLPRDAGDRPAEGSQQAGADGRDHVRRSRRPIAAAAGDAFQIVCVAFGLRNVADTDRGLAEMVRVAAPGGHVAVLEFSTPTWQPFKAVYGWYFRHVLPRIGSLFARDSADAYEYLPTSVGEFPQGEALAERMRAAGLDELRRYPLTFGVATLYVGKKR